MHELYTNLPGDMLLELVRQRHRDLIASQSRPWLLASLHRLFLSWRTAALVARPTVVRTPESPRDARRAAGRAWPD